MSCVIAGHFRDPDELARARCGVVALSAYAKRGANAKREESATKGTLAGRASSDVVTFRGESRASVIGVRSANLSEHVRARRGIAALNAYAIGGTIAKREQGATKSTPAGHASDGTVAFRGGAGELKLEPCVPSGVVHGSDDTSDV